MSDIEAYQILASELAQFRSLSYSDLAQFVGPSTSRRIRGKDFMEYATEVNVRWRFGVPGDIVVDGWIAVDDCGPVRRLDDAFIVTAPTKE